MAHPSPVIHANKARHGRINSLEKRFSRIHADGSGSAGVLARSLRRLAEGIRAAIWFTKKGGFFSPTPVGGTPTGSDRDGRAPPISTASLRLGPLSFHLTFKDESFVPVNWYCVKNVLKVALLCIWQRSMLVTQDIEDIRKDGTIFSETNGVRCASRSPPPAT